MKSNSPYNNMNYMTHSSELTKAKAFVWRMHELNTQWFWYKKYQYMKANYNTILWNKDIVIV